MNIIAGVVLVLLALLIISSLISAAFSLVGLALTLFMAGLIGWLADQIIPGELPYGWVGAVVAGLVGGLLGSLLLGRFGPQMFGVRIIPTFAGALIVVAATELFLRANAGESRRVQ